MPVVEVPFEVTGWEEDPAPLELGDAGSVAFGRVTLRKTFTGALAGSSVVSMTSAAVGEAPVGYSALELVTGTLEGRSGTFVLQHSGVVDDGAPSPSGVVLPETGTGQLSGLRGSMTIEHDESGAVLHLDYQLP
jgi:ABC-type sulfate transport system permease subunit